MDPGLQHEFCGLDKDLDRVCAPHLFHHDNDFLQFDPDHLCTTSNDLNLSSFFISDKIYIVLRFSPITTSLKLTDHPARLKTSIIDPLGLQLSHFQGF